MRHQTRRRAGPSHRAQSVPGPYRGAQGVLHRRIDMTGQSDKSELVILLPPLRLRRPSQGACRQRPIPIFSDICTQPYYRNCCPLKAAGSP